MEIPSTMPEQVSLAKELEISYRTLHPSVIMYDKDSDRRIRFPFSSIVNKYKDYLSNIIIEIELNAEEQAMYLYKPKLLSEDLYGTTELWDTILILNDCQSVIDFKPRFVNIYDPENLKELLNEIMLIEESIGNISF